MPLAVFLISFALITGAGIGLDWLSDYMGFWPYMAFCAVGVGALITFGYAYDALERRRIQR